MSTLKNRVDKLYSQNFDATGSEIIITHGDKVLIKAKSKKKSFKLVRIVMKL